MRKRMFTIVTAMLVLICLIFFVVKFNAGEAVYEGILVDNHIGEIVKEKIFFSTKYV